MARWLEQQGHDAKHTLDLPQANRTADAEVTAIAERENRVVVTKDEDFVHSHLVSGRPSFLLLVATGNIGNPDLFVLFRSCLPQILSALEGSRYIGLTGDALIVHD